MPAITPPPSTTTPSDSVALRALSGYVHRVAAGLGVGPESTWCEVADRANAYVALDHPLPDRHHHDLALLWDERHGWAAVAENRTRGEDPVVLAYYGTEALPSPDEVIAFTRRVLSGERAGQQHPPECRPGDLATGLGSRQDRLVDLS